MYAKNTKSVTVEPLLLESYLAFAKGSAGAKAFQKYYCKVNGKKMEVLQGGNLSCGFYTSAILKIFSLIDETQITVHRTLDAMERSGWKKIQKPKAGAVILYGESDADNGRMKRDDAIYASRVRHLGIFIGKGEVIHNSDKKRLPIITRWNYRPVEAIFWNTKLNKLQ